MMTEVVLALVASVFTASASVLQRLAAAPAPGELRLSWRLVVYLVHRPLWFLGVLCMILGLLFQLAALRVGDLSLVEPIVASELLFVFAFLAVYHRGGVRPREWMAAAGMAGSLGGFLFLAHPRGGSTTAASAWTWLLAGAACGTAAMMLAICSLARARHGDPPSAGRRAALLGASAGIGWGFVAAVVKELSVHLGGGLSAVLTNWSPYVLLLAGAGAMFLASNAFQAGPLAASQPGLTILDPFVAVLLGVSLYGEHVHHGGQHLAGEAVLAVVLCASVVLLSRSPLVAGRRAGAPAHERADGVAPPRSGAPLTPPVPERPGTRGGAGGIGEPRLPLPGARGPSWRRAAAGDVPLPAGVVGSGLRVRPGPSGGMWLDAGWPLVSRPPAARCRRTGRALADFYGVLRRLLRTHAVLVHADPGSSADRSVDRGETMNEDNERISGTSGPTAASGPPGEAPPPPGPSGPSGDVPGPGSGPAPLLGDPGPGDPGRGTGGQWSGDPAPERGPGGPAADNPPTWPGWPAGAAAGPPGPGYGGPGGYGPYGYGPYGYGGWGAGWPPPPQGAWGAPGGPVGAARLGDRKPARRLVLGAAALLTAIAVLLGVGIGYAVWSTGTSASSSRTASPSSPFGFGTRSTTSTTGSRSGSTGGSSRSSAATGSPSNISSIAGKVDPGLVDVNTVLGYQNGQAAGTGMVLTASGEVLTNNHVIEGATKISVTDLGNGTTYPATVVGYDRSLDVAVIQLEGASGLQTVATDTSTTSVGEAVVGIGNAGGLGGKPATAGGSVVALDQSITASDQADQTTEHLTGLIETNARIEAGDSGGPLVNASGHAIGMDTAASAAQGFTFHAATGNGYAIPIATALSAAKQIEAGNGTSSVHIGKTAFLGVGVAPVGQSQRSGTGLFRPGSGGLTATPTATSSTRTPSSGPTSGAAVVRVVPGSPAQKAGLSSGDVITALGGKTVTSPNSLSDSLIPYHPGDKISVQLTNGSGQQQSVTVQLATGPAA
ncbi:MAG: DMT family transporter [Acidimicrobiales bacterium]